MRPCNVNIGQSHVFMNKNTFVTGGPKNNGYELQKPDKSGNATHFNVRGVTRNYKNKLNVNFNVLKE